MNTETEKEPTQPLGCWYSLPIPIRWVITRFLEEGADLDVLLSPNKDVVTNLETEVNGDMNREGFVDLVEQQSRETALIADTSEEEKIATARQLFKVSVDYLLRSLAAKGIIGSFRVVSDEPQKQSRYPLSYGVEIIFLNYEWSCRASLLIDPSYHDPRQEILLLTMDLLYVMPGEERLKSLQMYYTIFPVNHQQTMETETVIRKYREFIDSCIAQAEKDNFANKHALLEVSVF